jgi:hypothetical protein
MKEFFKSLADSGCVWLVIGLCISGAGSWAVAEDRRS